MTFENSFKVAWTSNSDGYERYGYPIFWFSSDKYKEAPIKLPMTLDNNPGLMMPTASAYAKLSGARLAEYCYLMTNARGLRKIYETPKTITGLDIANLAVTSILAAGTPPTVRYPAAFSYPNVIYGWGGSLFFYENLTSAAGGIGSTDIQERLKALKTLINWEYFEAGLTKRGATKEGLEIIRKNSCLLYLLGNNIGDIEGSLGGLLTRSGSGWGISYGNPPEGYALFNGVTIPGSKILPQQFYYKTNSYANCYPSPSLCVTNMWIDFCDGKGFQKRALPPCTTSLNPTDLNNSADNIETITELKNQISEYIRRDYPGEQEVATALMFGGNLAIPEAKKPNEMARLSQLPNKDDILRGLVYEK